MNGGRAPADEHDTDVDDSHDEQNHWHLPEPFNEIVAMWSDAADELKRMHDASAQN